MKVILFKTNTKAWRIILLKIGIITGKTIYNPGCTWSSRRLDIIYYLNIHKYELNYPKHARKLFPKTIGISPSARSVVSPLTIIILCCFTKLYHLRKNNVNDNVIHRNEKLIFKYLLHNHCTPDHIQHI